MTLTQLKSDNEMCWSKHGSRQGRRSTTFYQFERAHGGCRRIVRNLSDRDQRGVNHAGSL